MIDANLVTPQARLIGQLNPIIKGWRTDYYTTMSSKETFCQLAYLTFIKLKRWAKRRHPNKSWGWIYRKYWRRELGVWDFAPRDGIPLYRHEETPIRRHTKVRNNKSPYDGDWVYWTKRRGRQPGLPGRVAALLKQQAGQCAYYGLYFQTEDKLEVDHIISKSRGGRDNYDNRKLLHDHCHHQKTAEDQELRRLEALMTAASRARRWMGLASQVRF